MVFLGAHRLLAFDASSVRGASLARGFGGERLASAVAPLAPGLIRVSAQEANIPTPADVVPAVADISNRLGWRGRATTLVLPMGVARIQLLELPGGADAREYARFRLAASLPFAVTEAIIDTLPLDGGRVLAAAVRRQVVAGYEDAARAGGVAVGQVDLAGLAALGSFVRRAPAGPAVLVILGDAALGFAAFERGRLVGFRQRIRGGGLSLDFVLGEARRTARHSGVQSEPRLLITGPGAPDLLRAFLGSGRPAELVAAGQGLGPLPEATALAFAAGAWT